MQKNSDHISSAIFHLVLAACLYLLGEVNPYYLNSLACADVIPEAREYIRDQASIDISEPGRGPAVIMGAGANQETNQTPNKTQVMLSDDPCLPALYKDWSEFSADSEDYRRTNKIIGARILIDVEAYSMSLQAILESGQSNRVIMQNVAVGDARTPTPKGSYILNHIYCYPDVRFFGENSRPVSGLYNGFFAPLLVCDNNLNCRRIKELGLHGFQGRFHPGFSSVNLETFGAVSAGCVRIPDPCSFKMELIRIVGVGPIKTNERGSYHWLKKPVQVIVHGRDIEPGEHTLLSIVEESISNLGSEIANMIGSLYK